MWSDAKKFAQKASNAVSSVANATADAFKGAAKAGAGVVVKAIDTVIPPEVPKDQLYNKVTSFIAVINDFPPSEMDNKLADPVKLAVYDFTNDLTIAKNIYAAERGKNGSNEPAALAKFQEACKSAIKTHHSAMKEEPNFYNQYIRKYINPILKYFHVKRELLVDETAIAKHEDFRKNFNAISKELGMKTEAGNDETVDHSTGSPGGGGKNQV